jgi:hypothetical protein
LETILKWLTFAGVFGGILENGYVIWQNRFVKNILGAEHLRVYLIIGKNESMPSMP